MPLIFDDPDADRSRMREPCPWCREEAEAGLTECRYCWRDLADLIRESRTDPPVPTTIESTDVVYEGPPEVRTTVQNKNT